MAKKKNESQRVAPLQNPPASAPEGPVSRRDEHDPGDVTNRKFRYQFAYGVMLLVGAASGKLDYKAIWCEQHEDLLGEIDSDLFDALQIKTRSPEAGDWETNDEAFWKSIKRFVSLDRDYNGRFRHYHFVSNVKCSESASRDRKKYSPIMLHQAVSAVANWSELSGAAKEGFEILLAQIKGTPEELFKVLSKLKIVLGPPELSYEAEIAQNHLPHLPECARLDARSLAKVRECLISRVGTASSLSTDDPARHYAVILNGERHDPLLEAKRITVDDLRLAIGDLVDCKFNYLDDFATLRLGSASNKMDVMKVKLSRGGLGQHVEMMRRRALSAEAHLLEIATQSTDQRKTLSQIENVVMSVCDDALLKASASVEPFGREMLVDVQARLDKISKDGSQGPQSLDKELLVGVAGLLTAECLVWWSKQFDLEKTQ